MNLIHSIYYSLDGYGFRTQNTHPLASLIVVLPVCSILSRYRAASSNVSKLIVAVHKRPRTERNLLTQKNHTQLARRRRRFFLSLLIHSFFVDSRADFLLILADYITILLIVVPYKSYYILIGVD